MSTISHHPSEAGERKSDWSAHLRVREMWASLAIAVMSLAVLFTSVYGPDIVTDSVTSHSRVPSGIAVALFAFLGTWVVAWFGFRQRPDD
jgi:hypothetical protein